MAVNQFGQPIGEPIVGWSGATLPSQSQIHGQYCSLTSQLDISMAAELFIALHAENSEPNWTYLPYGPFNTEAEFTHWFEQTCFEKDPFFHVIYLKGSNRPVGLAAYLRVNAEAGSIEVGHIHLSMQLQRTAAATEAMFLLMSHAFDHMGYRRYEWKCDALNAPSLQAALRLGFTHEGTFRQATTYKNRNRDTAWLSITDKEWPAIKQAFTTWLNPSNFDENGAQCCPLAAK